MFAHQNNTHIGAGRLIFRDQRFRVEEGKYPHEELRDAVRAWASSGEGQVYVAAVIGEAWRAAGGDGLDVPEDPEIWKTKLFRWLDGDSPRYRRYVQELAPSIMSVMPLEFRSRLIAPDERMARIADAMKECAEAKQAALLGAPEGELKKEVSEGIASLFRLAPPDAWAPILASVTTMLGSI